MFWGHFSTDLGFKDKKLANIVWRLGGYPFPPVPLGDVHWEFMHTVRGQNSLGCVCKSHLVCLFTWRLPQPCISQHMTCTSIYLTLAKSDFLTVAIPFQLVQKWVQNKTFSQKSFPIGEALPFYGPNPPSGLHPSQLSNQSFKGLIFWYWASVREKDCRFQSTGQFHPDGWLQLGQIK